MALSSDDADVQRRLPIGGVPAEDLEALALNHGLFPAERLGLGREHLGRLYHLGSAALTRGENDDAARLFGACVALDPAWSPGWLGVGALFSALREHATASTCFLVAVQLDPGPAPRVLAALSLAASGESARAIELCDQALASRTRDGEAGRWQSQARLLKAELTFPK